MRHKARHGSLPAWLLEASRAETDDCVLWPFGQSNGYGSARFNGKWMHAHRVICLMVHGEPSPGQTDAAHSCGNRLCCNPRHIRHATAYENQQDKIAHGRSGAGSQNARAKLQEHEVRRIRELCAHGTQASVAAQYGVTVGAVNAIVKGRRWAWLP